ncbi:MAG TPA: hypothetical protein VHE34_09950 [Puia sp.]|uniref:hypothetical protein n=1 Tax=Puia sp. TaxID=2045100 RepID=UPI002CEAE28F|nr:hypothetical protein [Puia sp.]HVU95538.1 hypothetical protein [Puia sp.]
MANEMNVAVANADLLMEKDLNNLVSKLSDQNSRILISIAQLNKTAQETVKAAYNLKDATVLDLRKILGDYLPLGKSYFYVQRVDGITQLFSAQNDNKFSIAGIGFGFDSEKFKSRIISIDQMKPTDFTETKNDANLSGLVIKRERISALIQNPIKIAQIKLNITIQIRRQTGLIIHSWETKTFTLPITLSIVPAVLPDLKVKYSMPKYDWVTVPGQDPISYSHTTADHDQHDQRHDNIHTFTEDDVRTIPNNFRYVNPRPTSPASGNGCPWTHLEFIHIEEGGTKIHAQFSTWGLPCAYNFGATVQQYQQVGVIEDNVQSITGIKYGSNIVVTLPKACPYWELTGRTIDNNDINIIGEKMYGSLIVYSDALDDGVNKKIVYTVGYPF